MKINPFHVPCWVYAFVLQIRVIKSPILKDLAMVWQTFREMDGVFGRGAFLCLLLVGVSLCGRLRLV